MRNIAGAKRPGLVKKMQKVFEIVAIQSRKATRENRRQIVQRDKRQRRTVKYIDLAIERLTTGACYCRASKRHHLSEGKVRRYIDRAVLLARSRMLEKKERHKARSGRIGEISIGV